MRYSRIINVIFISSLLLLLPSVTPDIEQQIILRENEYLVISVKTPQVIIETDIILPVLLNVSYFDAVNSEIVSLYNETIQAGLELTLDIPDRGDYLFQFYAEAIGFVTISQQGTFLTTYGIILLTGFLNFLVIMYKRYFDFSVY